MPFVQLYVKCTKNSYHYIVKTIVYKRKIPTPAPGFINKISLCLNGIQNN